MGQRHFVIAHFKASEDKAAIRATVLARRDALSPEVRTLATAEIAKLAAPAIASFQPRLVAGYVPIRSEADPGPLMRELAKLGVRFALPVTAGDTMAFHPWQDGNDLTPGRFGVQQPRANGEPVAPDVILLPLAAFDPAGNRIGYGRGFYDRAVSALRSAGHTPRLVGIAFALQRVASIPAETHDIRLDLVVTEAGVTTIR